MNKHAYLIVANSNWKVVNTCLKLIDDIRNDIYLLIDKKTHLTKHQIDGLKSICKESKLFIYNCIMVNWGGYSQIDAVLYLIAAATNNSISYEYFHFLQGSDLPIKSQNQIHDFFRKSNGLEFISVEKNRTYMANNKCQFYHFFCHNKFFRRNKLVKVLNFTIVYLQKVLGIKHNLDIELYQGSALFSITGEFAKYLLSKKDEIYHRFRYSLAGDECFIQTIAMKSPFKDKICGIDKTTSFNARLIDRTRPDGKNSPHVWRSAEFETIIHQPNGYCFARKFDERIDIEIVKRIEAYIKQNGKEI